MKKFEQIEETADRKLFNNIDISKSVIVNGEKHEILKKGSNFLTTLTESREVNRIWASSVTEQGESVDYLTDIFSTSTLDESIKQKFLDSLQEFNQTYTDKAILLIAFRNLEEQVGAPEIQRKLESINQFNHTYLKENMYTQEDKWQVAKIISEALGSSLADTPEATIKLALNSDKAHALSEAQKKSLDSMLAIAEEVGIAIEPETEEFSEDEIDDADIDALIDQLTEEDFFDVYEDSEFSVVDFDTGEKINEEDTQLHEVLSRMERIKSRIRFARTEANRHRKLQIALDKRSSTDTLNKRARRLAVKAIERKIAKKDLATLSVSEKERVEKRIQKLKNVVKRVSARMMPRVRQIEKDRLTNKHHTKDE